MISDPQKALYTLLHKIENNYSTGIIRDLLKTAYQEYDKEVKAEQSELKDIEQITNICILCGKPTRNKKEKYHYVCSLGVLKQ